MANIIHFSEGTESVLNKATLISSIGDEFFGEYNELYSLVENDLSRVWKGEDSEALKVVVNNEKVHFESMREVINDYVNFLITTAKAHEARKDDSKEQASANCQFE